MTCSVSQGNYSRTSLFIRLICNSVHLLIPNSQTLPFPALRSVVGSFLQCFRFHIEVISCSIRVFLTHFISMIISSCIRVAANDIFLFFMAE